MANKNCKTIRIVSDGTKTKVYDAITGEAIHGVQTIEFSTDARKDEAPFAKITIIRPELDITCDAHIEVKTISDVVAESDLHNLPDNDIYKMTKNFSAEMCRRLIHAHRRQGKTGWWKVNKAVLLDALKKNLEQGDMLDVANYAMMLHLHKNFLRVWEDKEIVIYEDGEMKG